MWIGPERGVRRAAGVKMCALILLFLAIAIALPCVSAVPRHPQKIVGGVPTTVDKYPFMANMQYGYWTFWWQACGGSLITSRSILSASHCYIGDPMTSWRVRLGTTFASSGGTVFEVRRILIHPRYSDDSLSNDVAIVHLETSATFSDTIQTVPIAGPTYNLADGTRTTVMGWGTTTYLGSSPEQLQEVDIFIVNQQLCAERYAYLKTLPGYGRWPDVDDSMLCAGIQDVGGADACQGDSGGPVVHLGTEPVVVGVVSWGYQCADPYWPGVLADVSYNSAWIVENGSV